MKKRIITNIFLTALALNIVACGDTSTEPAAESLGSNEEISFIPINENLVEEPLNDDTESVANDFISTDPEDVTDTSESPEYYTEDNLVDGFFAISEDNFYPIRTEKEENVNYVPGFLSDPSTYYIYTSDYSEELIPHFSKDQQFAYRGDTSNGYNYSIKQFMYSGYTYDLLTISSNDYAYSWTEQGKDYKNIKTINGNETNFYRFCEDTGYLRIDEDPTYYSTSNFGGDILFSDSITEDTALTIGYFGSGTDFIEETIYPTIWFATSNRTESDPYSKEPYHSQLICEQTTKGYFVYSFPHDIESGYYTLGPSTKNADTPLPLLIYIE